eukprot:SAG31_NODE_2248_length_6093_cov_4.382716_5_plen_59_part_00
MRDFNPGTYGTNRESVYIDRFSAGNGYYPVWNLCALDPSFPLPNKVFKHCVFAIDYHI